MGKSKAADDLGECIIAFPGACAQPTEKRPSLFSIFEDNRKFACKLPFPIREPLAMGRLNTAISEADTTELVAADDEIALSHLARMAVKEVTRYEECYQRHLDIRERQHPGVARSAPAVNDVRTDRDHAINAYLAVRERQAKIRHLERINNRETARERPATVLGAVGKGHGVA